MKGGRKSRSTGGVNEDEDDIKDKPERRNNAKKIEDEAEEMKKGGRAKRKSGGKTEVGKIEGHKEPMHAGRKPRKSGGRTGSEASPFTGANKGREPAGHKTMGPDPVLGGMDQKA
jgi:hypothetical protein